MSKEREVGNIFQNFKRQLTEEHEEGHEETERRTNHSEGEGVSARTILIFF